MADVNVEVYKKALVGSEQLYFAAEVPTDIETPATKAFYRLAINSTSSEISTGVSATSRPDVTSASASAYNKTENKKISLDQPYLKGEPNSEFIKYLTFSKHEESEEFVTVVVAHLYEGVVTNGVNVCKGQTYQVLVTPTSFGGTAQESLNIKADLTFTGDPTEVNVSVTLATGVAVVTPIVG